MQASPQIARFRQLWSGTEGISVCTNGVTKDEMGGQRVGRFTKAKEKNDKDDQSWKPAV
jgi:hypothetical protein